MGRLFAGSNVPDLENAMTVFELAELKGRGDVQAVVLMLVVFLSTQRMYHGPRTRAKAIVIDEAWDLLSGEDSKAFLEGAARRARKYRGALVTGTQSVNDYYANPAARAAWENSDWVIFLAQKDESVELLKSEKRIHCDPGMERGAQEPDHGGRALCRAGAARPRRLAGRAAGARCLVGGAVFVARPGLRGRGDPEGPGAHHRRGHRSARGRRCPRPCRTLRTIRIGGNRMTAKRSRTGSQGPLNWPDDPETVTAADIDFEALAHVLANTCRRGGCTRRYHSVAAHAVIVSEEIAALDGLGEEDRRRLALHALIADAPSAWLRGRLPDSQRAAERAGKLASGIETAVREAAGLDAVIEEEQAELLKFVTRMASAAECRDIMEDAPASAGVAFPPLKRRIRPIPPDKAAEGWLARFRALAGQEGQDAGEG